MNIKELSSQYYDAIMNYEAYLSKQQKESIEYPKDKIIADEVKKLTSIMEKKYEKRYMPWRLVKDDLLHHLQECFSSKEYAMQYIGVEDGISEILDIYAEEDLEKYYSKQGYNVENDFIKDHIFMEYMLLSDGLILDEKKYSKSTLELIEIKELFSNVCQKLLEYYKTLDVEKSGDLEIEKKENRKENNMISEKELLVLREKYPSETKIKLLKDIDDIPVGTIGMVDFVDDAGNINMEWENGSSLSLIEGKDSFDIVSIPEKIRVIIVEPEKDPYVKEIYNTLRAKQDIVGGLIQCVPSLFDDKDTYDFIVNDEGKIIGLPLNRFIYNKQDIVCGNLIIAKPDLETGDFISIEESEVNFLMDKINNECPKCSPIDLANLLDKSNDDMEEIEK